MQNNQKCCRNECERVKKLKISKNNKYQMKEKKGKKI